MLKVYESWYWKEYRERKWDWNWDKKKVEGWAVKHPKGIDQYDYNKSHEHRAGKESTDWSKSETRIRKLEDEHSRDHSSSASCLQKKSKHCRTDQQSTNLDALGFHRWDQIGQYDNPRTVR